MRLKIFFRTSLTLFWLGNLVLTLATLIVPRAEAQRISMYGNLHYMELDYYQSKGILFIREDDLKMQYLDDFDSIFFENYSVDQDHAKRIRRFIEERQGGAYFSRFRPRGLHLEQLSPNAGNFWLSVNRDQKIYPTLESRVPSGCKPFLLVDSAVGPWTLSPNYSPVLFHPDPRITVVAAHNEYRVIWSGIGPYSLGPENDAALLELLRWTSSPTFRSFKSQHQCLVQPAGYRRGSVVCFGNNNRGQLGLGRGIRHLPAEGHALTRIYRTQLGKNFVASKVFFGGERNCAMSGDGEVKCWGDNAFGALGQGHDRPSVGFIDDEMGDKLPALDLGRFKPVKLAIGAAHVCGFNRIGQLKCWGNNEYGQLGLGDREAQGTQPDFGSRLPTVDLGDPFVVTDIALGRRHSCALSGGREVKCWGYSVVTSETEEDIGSEPDHMGNNLAAIEFPTGHYPEKIASGANHLCTLGQDGDVMCWGTNSFGQLGQGHSLPRQRIPGPVDLGRGEKAKDLQCGDFHCCALLDSRKMKCWGDNSYGQLGLGDSQNRGSKPDSEEEFLPYTKFGKYEYLDEMRIFGDTSCAHTPNGWKCWGMSVRGQAGFGTTKIGTTPETIPRRLPILDVLNFHEARG